ncbi:XRE family transcriptional regulator [Leptospira sp. WS92.C1]
MPNKITTVPLENTDLPTPGKRLRYTIKNILTMNDADFAMSIGKSQNYISYISNDKRPLLDKLAAEIEFVHHISGLWLMKGTGTPEVNRPLEENSETVKKIKKRDFLWSKIVTDRAEETMISLFENVPMEKRTLIYQMIRAVSDQNA